MQFVIDRTFVCYLVILASASKRLNPNQFIVYYYIPSNNLVEWIENPAMCIAKNMEKAMEGAGTDDASLTRLVVRNRTPAFMAQIKANYTAKYKKSLRDRIKGETSGDYRRTLLMAIGEPERG